MVFLKKSIDRTLFVCYKYIELVKTNFKRRVKEMFGEIIIGSLIVLALTTLSYEVKKTCRKYILRKGARVS